MYAEWCSQRLFCCSFNSIELVTTDVKQEKQHNQLIQSVEGFNPDLLRKTETQEKVVLPNAEGYYFGNLRIATFF